MKNVYNKEFFTSMLNQNLPLDDLIKVINKSFNCGQGEYRQDCWAYAGDILWCRDIYGKTYRISELVEKAMNWYKDNEETSDYLYVLSKLYMMLLMIHPFEDANGRTIFTFISILAFSKNIIIQVPILFGTERIHESFREVEHLTYNKIKSEAISHLKKGKLRIDKRIHEGYNIGNFTYSSLLYILFEMKDNGIYNEMIDFFKGSIINENDLWIKYLE